MMLMESGIQPFSKGEYYGRGGEGWTCTVVVDNCIQHLKKVRNMAEVGICIHVVVRSGDL